MQREGMYVSETLLRIPKTDLHLHLDGSLRLDSLIELADTKLELPSQTIEGLKELSLRRIRRFR